VLQVNKKKVLYKYFLDFFRTFMAKPSTGLQCCILASCYTILSLDICTQTQFSLQFSMWSLIQSVMFHIVTRRLKAGLAEPEQTFITRQPLGKQVPAEMNAQATKELSFLCNGGVSTSE
jgi:hypothetical protein